MKILILIQISIMLSFLNFEKSKYVFLYEHDIINIKSKCYLVDKVTIIENVRKGEFAKYIPTSALPSITISNGSDTVNSFNADFSNDKKKVIGYFPYNSTLGLEKHLDIKVTVGTMVVKDFAGVKIKETKKDIESNTLNCTPLTDSLLNIIYK